MCGGTQVIVLALLVCTQVFGRRRSLVRYPFPFPLWEGLAKSDDFQIIVMHVLLLCVTSSTQCKRSVKLQRIHFAIFAKWL